MGRVQGHYEWARRDTPPVARTAADLPPGRRETLAWRLSDRDGFHLAQALDHLEDTCEASLLQFEQLPPFDRAVADRSGIYHLFAGSRAACLGRFTESRWCEAQVSRSGAEPVSNVANIPLELRCDRAAGRWPPQIDGKGPRAKIRRRLVEELGCGCATCPDPWATKIDHDHLTGLVRGYLCGACNTVVDLCRHLSGCRFADYLANPPAAPLGIEYPGWRAQLASPRYVARCRRPRETARRRPRSCPVADMRTAH
ncbi:hypothetical protein IG195_21650 (plasmid) [Arthrobacter sp. TES]|nr:hypothetical protein IG195_21650 [Arthrobacter sp. TES]